MSDLNQLPADLPVPDDDGAADHLAGHSVPHLSLPSTTGRTVALDGLAPDRQHCVRRPAR